MPTTRTDLRLICLNCGGPLPPAAEQRLVCPGCSAAYPLEGRRPVMLLPEDRHLLAPTSDDVPGIERIKALFKRHSRLYYFLVALFSPGLSSGDRSRQLVAMLPPDGLIVDLGAGPRRVAPHTVNVDLFPYEEVDVIANAARLPWADGSVDGVICKAMLEHVPDPWALVAEIRRVLREDGLVFVIVPFLIGFHSSPSDYHRWTSQGVLHLMKDFEMVEMGLRGGPTSALAWILQEWLALSLSFNLDLLYTVFYFLFGVLLAPLKLLDIILSRYKHAKKISYGFFYVGRKRSGALKA